VRSWQDIASSIVLSGSNKSFAPTRYREVVLTSLH